MKAIETLNIQGQLTLQKRDINDAVLEEIKAKNSIVLTGRELVAKLFMPSTQNTITPVSHVGIGIGSNPVNFNDTKLQQEIFRKELNETQRLEVVEIEGIRRQKVTLSADLTANEGNGALTEAALFNSNDEEALMYNRVTFPVINKSSNFSLTLIWEIIF